jgi:hypothetical protein
VSYQRDVVHDADPNATSAAIILSEFVFMAVRSTR